MNKHVNNLALQQGAGFDVTLVRLTFLQLETTRGKARLAAVTAVEEATCIWC